VQLRSQQADQGESLSGDALPADDGASAEENGSVAAPVEGDAGLDREPVASSHDDTELPAPSWLMAAFESPAASARQGDSAKSSEAPEAPVSTPANSTEEK
jgi:hypothetical protein